MLVRLLLVMLIVAVVGGRAHLGDYDPGSLDEITQLVDSAGDFAMVEVAAPPLDPVRRVVMIEFAAPAVATGQLHAVTVFRPPRSIASC